MSNINLYNPNYVKNNKIIFELVNDFLLIDLNLIYVYTIFIVK